MCCPCGSKLKPSLLDRVCEKAHATPHVVRRAVWMHVQAQQVQALRQGAPR